MSKDIRIRISSVADLKAIHDASAAAAKMVKDVKRSNDEMRQSVLKSAAAYDSVAARADKVAFAARGTVLSAKQIEEAWRNAMSTAKTHTEDAKRSVTGLGRAVQVVGGILGGMTGPVGFIAKNLLLGSIWKVAGRVIEIFSDKVKKAREELEKAKEAKLSEELKAIAAREKDISDMFDKGVAAIDKQVEKTKELLGIQKKLVDAERELQKQKELTAATGNPEAQAIIEKKYKMRSDETNASSQADSLLAEFNAAVKKIDEGEKFLRDMDRWFADADGKIKEYESKIAEIEAHARTAAIHGSVNNAQEYLTQSGEAKDYARYKKQLEEIRAARAKGESNVQTMKNRIAGYSETMERTSSELAALDKLREARQIENERYVAEKGAAIDKAEAEEEKAAREAAEKKAKEDAAVAEKRAEADRKAAEKRAEAEEKAAEKAAAERARLDAQEATRRERERQAELAAKIKDHQKLLTAERTEESKTRSAVSAAESKLQRAWGWYRDKDSMSAQMQEEKADAAARKQFEKDFARLRSRRRDWRNAENLSVDDEAVRRVAIAREEKAEAERHLAEIEKNTANLAEKLDELLAMK